VIKLITNQNVYGNHLSAVANQAHAHWVTIFC